MTSNLAHGQKKSLIIKIVNEEPEVEQKKIQ